MRLKHLFLPVTGLALISLASPSYADRDYKVHPGSQCQPSLGSESGDVIRGPGFIYNTNPNKTLSVTCPILRDNIFGPPQSQAASSFGVEFDGTAGRSIQCRFFSLARNGSEVYSSTQFTDPNQNYTSLSWVIAANQTGSVGTYSINCELPVNVFLLHIFSFEGDATDGGR